MKKGKVLLNALIVMRKLKPICNAYEISYKYAHSLASTNKNPSWSFMNSIKDIIPPPVFGSMKLILSIYNQ